MTTSEPDTSNWKRTPDGIPIPPPSVDDVIYEPMGDIGRVVLNRPTVLNALNKNMQRRLDAALDAAEADTNARAIILTGAGRGFCAGGDMWSSLYPDEDPAPSSMEVQTRIFDFPKPVVAAVRGHAVGQGFELAAMADITIASETARFGEIQIRHGFGPPQLIAPFIVGLKHAKEVLMLGEALTAEDAYRMGIANRVVADIELDAAAEAMARKLAGLPENTMRLNKALVNRVYRLAGMDQAMNYREDPALAALFEGRDAVAQERHRIREQQGWAAFKETRDQGYEK
ncbi:MAG: enoyl-CoA hydratase/isomerase family protein [Dehalococcoidia bacterium]